MNPIPIQMPRLYRRKKKNRSGLFATQLSRLRICKSQHQTVSEYDTEKNDVGSIASTAVGSAESIKEPDQAHVRGVCYISTEPMTATRKSTPSVSSTTSQAAPDADECSLCGSWSSCFRKTENGIAHPAACDSFADTDSDRREKLRKARNSAVLCYGTCAILWCAPVAICGVCCYPVWEKGIKPCVDSCASHCPYQFKERETVCVTHE